ncbi:MAG: hypothetical protein ABI743_09315 [bacterium]
MEPGAATAAPQAPYEGARRFLFSALPQGADLETASARGPIVPWALAYNDEMEQERFYLTGTDLLRELPQLLNRLRSLPVGGNTAQQLLNQGFPCYLFASRQEYQLVLNVAAYRDGGDRLLREDIIMTWEEFVALLTLGIRRLLTDLLQDYPPMARFLGSVIETFNAWAVRWSLSPFQMPAIEWTSDDTATPSAGTSAKPARSRRSPLLAPVYLQEWKTHKSLNLRLNNAILICYGLLLLLALFPLWKVPLGYWIYPLLAVGIPWWLGMRYPAIPLHSRLWTDGGVKYRFFFPDTIVALSAIMLVLASSFQHANVLWLGLFPLGCLICLFCGLGFPLTHWARPLWDWDRRMIIASLLTATFVLSALAEYGQTYSVALNRSPNDEAPRPVVIHTAAQDQVRTKWAPLVRPAALPVAWVIDEYSTQRSIHELLAPGTAGRAAFGWLAQYLWLAGVVTYGLGLRWARLPSPLEVKISTREF